MNPVQKDMRMPSAENFTSCVKNELQTLKLSKILSDTILETTHYIAEERIPLKDVERAIDILTTPILASKDRLEIAAIRFMWKRAIEKCGCNKND